MRIITLLSLTAALACGDSKDTESKPGAAEPKSASATDTVTPSDAKAAKKAKPKPAPLECAQWLAPDLVKTHCGADIGPWEDGTTAQTAITCSRGAKQDGSRIAVTFEKLLGGRLGATVKRRYPDPPKLEKQHSKRRTLKGRNFPFLLTVYSSGKPLCTDEQLMALTKAVLAKLPGDEEPASKDNKACDALLTAADIKSKCGKEGTVNASMMEDGKSLYCNRSGRGLIFIVSKHASEDLAVRGAAVASDDTAAGVAQKGPYSIEMKTSAGTNACSKAGLDALAKLVAERL